MDAGNFDDSAEFRRHIRNLLYDYSIAHCTTNYLTFTEDLVAEFIETLKPVPLTDLYSLTIAVEPYETFSKLHSLPTLPPYDETPQTTNEALAYIRKVVAPAVGRPKTERVIWDDSYVTSRPLPEEPIYAALTRSSRMKTKKLGSKDGPQPPSTYAALVKSQNIQILDVEPVQEPVVSIEDALDLKLSIKPEDLAEVRGLLQTTADMIRPQTTHKNKYMDANYLRNNLPPLPIYEPPEELFMPIFPRRGKNRITSVERPVPDFKSLVKNPSIALKAVEVEDPDGDISRQNLIIVDGWETIRSSPPSTPLSNLSDEDQVDQLCLPSSPDTEPALVEEIEAAKLDVVLIPRCRKIGGSFGIAPHILHAKTLETFLKPLLFQPLRGDEEKCNEVPVPSSPASSLIGQPPSALEGTDGITIPALEGQNDDLDADLHKLYDGHNLDNFIMDETIDDKQSMLMEVPDLPPPNAFPRDGFLLPKSFSDFLIPPIMKNEKKQKPPAHQFLKKAKGCQSLGLALSWVPFTTDKKLPTVLEIVDVVDLSPKSLSESSSDAKSDYAEALRLLESVSFDDVDCSIDVAARRGLAGEEALAAPPEIDDSFHILMNRQERRRLAKLEGRELVCSSDDDAETHAPEGCSDPHLEVDMRRDCRRARDEELEDLNTLEHDAGRRHKKSRLELEPPLDVDFMDVPGDVHAPGAAPFDNGANYEVYADDGYSEEDKENSPPFSSSLSRAMDEGLDYGQYIPQDEIIPEDHLVEEQMEYEGSFEPLSFGSRPLQFQGRYQAPNEDDFRGYEQLDSAAEELLVEQHLQAPVKRQESPNDPGLSIEPDIASHTLGISAFAQLRARKVSKPAPVVMSEPTPIISEEPSQEQARGVPPDILDQNTISLPEIINVAQSVHKYMASLDFIQKHALVRALRSEECAVEVVERQSLGGVDIIIDPSTAIIFLSLFALPARCASYVERVSQQSWKFPHLLIVFEAYTHDCAKKYKPNRGGSSSADTGGSALYAYTPPILKAIKKFRRDLNIAEACGTKRAESLVNFAFADTVDEAALLSRCYGDHAEAMDETQGAIWGERVWLGIDYLEDEEANLAAMAGMNNFSASIILCQISLQEFIDMSPDERLQGFGGFIDPEAIMACNADLDARFSALHVSSGTLMSDVDFNNAS